MHYFKVAPNKIVRSDSDSFTYSSETDLNIGQIVLIEIGKKQAVGIIISKTTKPTYKTKQIIKTIEDNPLPIQLVKLSNWISKYYVAPLGTVLQTVLPRGIQTQRRQTTDENKKIIRNRTNILFNNEQENAIKTISESGPGTYLLHGITGSGKTEIYIEIAKQSINDNKSVIILVPEIALTSQLIAEFSNHFENLLVTHSKMTESMRHKIWLQAINSGKANIIIGPRSALFTPFKNIGAIIVDEAHEPSYKQDQTPKYSALRVATILGQLHKAKVIFGSATPNIVDKYLAEKSTKPILELTKIARIGSLPPKTTIVDMTKRNNFKKHRFLSDALIEQIDKTLNKNGQILIFHNRRGSTNTTICKSCGWSAKCPNCLLPLTLHSDTHNLHCHICNHIEKIPTSCKECGNTDIIFKGIGTKLIESEIKKIFPNSKIARFDADNNKDETLNIKYQDLYDGKINIIIGTQIVAKGLDLPHLRTVCIIQADTGLSMPDFGTNERVFQLLAQVVGRVGRNEHQTQVIIQTYQPNHPSIIYGSSQNYQAFYDNELIDRKRSLFPPYTYLLKINCVYKTEAAAIKNIKSLTNKLKTEFKNDIKFFGPSPAFYERQNNNYRWQIIIKSPSREHLINVLKYIPTKNFQYELDPASLL